MIFFAKNKGLLTFWGYFFVFLIPFVLFLSIQTAGQTLLCPDSFYHAKMASFLTEGKLIKDFPWLPYTVLSHFYIDHHFLYHLLLIPFVLIFGSLWGIKMATWIFATLTVVIFYWFLRKFKIKLALLWTFLLLTSSVFLTRLNLAKVPAVALPVLLLGLYALFKRKYIFLIIISFIYVWLYNTWPILLVAVIIYCFASALKKIIENWKLFENCPDAPLESVNKEVGIPTLRREKLVIGNFIKCLFDKENIGLILSCLLGIVCGLVINPYFPQNLFFDWVHIVKIGLENYQNILPVGVEWYPYPPLELVLNNILILLPWLIALAWFLVSFKKNKEIKFFGQPLKTWTLFVLSLLFFVYTIKSRRNIDYFIPLAVLFISFSFNNLFSRSSWQRYFKELGRLKQFPLNLVSFVLVCLILTVFVFAGWSIFQNIWQAKKTEFSGGAAFNKFEGVSLYLKKNARPGEIIFHSSWDEFPALFYHNDQNYYIAGLDPTFSYVENKPLYWLWQNIVTGKQKNNLAQTIEKNFKSRFVFIKADYKGLKKNLEEDGAFEKIYEDKDGFLYKIKE